MALNLTIKIVAFGLHFGRFYLQKHLVALNLAHLVYILRFVK
jgi:hypothetical protein